MLFDASCTEVHPLASDSAVSQDGDFQPANRHFVANRDGSLERNPADLGIRQRLTAPAMRVGLFCLAEPAWNAYYRRHPLTTLHRV